MKLSLDGQDLLTIKADGTIEFDPDYTPDELATAFWEKVGRRFVEYDILYRHMESVLSRIGISDISCEKLAYEVDAIRDPFKKDAMQDVLEVAREDFSQLIDEAVELGRGLAKRSLPIQDPPERFPECVVRDLDSEYRGAAAGIPSRKLN